MGHRSPESENAERAWLHFKSILVQGWTAFLLGEYDMLGFSQLSLHPALSNCIRGPRLAIVSADSGHQSEN